jgi:hypothetical protein
LGYVSWVYLLLVFIGYWVSCCWILSVLAALQAVHFESQRDQFSMKLQPEFENARAELINRTLVPSLEICLGEL